MGKVAVFVDAGYFWVQAVLLLRGDRGPREGIEIDFDKLRQDLLGLVAAEFPNDELLRVYWYDGPGAAGAKADSHLEIERLDDFKLRLGTRNGAGAQKAVDGLIIADLIGLAQNKAITSAVVVSGDADLTPGVIAAQGLGIRVHLLSLGTNAATSPFLKAEVDRKTHWPDGLVRAFAKEAAKTQIAAPAARIEEVVVAAADSGAVVAAAAISITPTEVSPIDIPSIAAAVFGRLDPTHEVVVSPSGMLPRKLDARLLAAGRKVAKRDLEEQERLSLRAEFKRLLEGRASVTAGAPEASE